jgi:teichuronic acid biosynthesis glycosyltransferase TuaC
MRVLYVCSYNSGRIAPFIREQVDALQKKGIEVSYFQIEGKGIWGYLQNLAGYKKAIQEFKPDIIHAHYGFSGLFANLQRKVPVISTFHGSDINEKLLRPFSFFAMLLSGHSIFVSKELAAIFRFKRRYSVLPCGIDIDIFNPSDKKNARIRMNLPVKQTLVLFSSSASYYVKNYPLAEASTKKVGAQLMELEGYTREQVCTLLNACDVALMTSYSEGSPQFIKEAMACNCPIVSTKVGNVEWIIGETDGCYLTSFEAADVASKLSMATHFSEKTGRTVGRSRILAVGLDNDTIADNIFEIYKTVLREKA